MGYINEHPNYDQWVREFNRRNWQVGTRNWLEEGGGEPDFAIYMFLANRYLMRSVGLGFDDIEDYLWRDAFDGDVPPREAARLALAHSGMDDDEVDAVLPRAVTP